MSGPLDEQAVSIRLPRWGIEELTLLGAENGVSFDRVVFDLLVRIAWKHRLRRRASSPGPHQRSPRRPREG
jgi:hypothetical protein